MIRENVLWTFEWSIISRTGRDSKRLVRPSPYIWGLGRQPVLKL